MIFTEWLKQYNCFKELYQNVEMDYETQSLLVLAHDIGKDTRFPQVNDFAPCERHLIFNGACDEAVATLEKAWNLYEYHKRTWRIA